MVEQRKPYVVIRELGTEQFEKVVGAHIEAGYIPVGGVIPFVEQNRFAGTLPRIGYIQAMVDVEAGMEASRPKEAACGSASS